MRLIIDSVALGEEIEKAYRSGMAEYLEGRDPARYSRSYWRRRREEIIKAITENSVAFPDAADEIAEADTGSLPRLAVVAPTYQWFREWCRENGLSEHSRRVVFVAGAANLRGRGGMPYLWLGDPEGRDVADILRSCLLQSGCRPVDGAELRAFISSSAVIR